MIWQGAEGVEDSVWEMGKGHRAVVLDTLGDRTIDVAVCHSSNVCKAVAVIR